MVKPVILPRPDVVLLVEEDRALSDLIQLSLKRRGFNVTVISNAFEAEESIQKINPFIILIDLFLSGTNGLVLLESLKSSGKLDKRRVIIISAYGFMEVIEQAIQMGVVDFIVKPVDVDLMVQKVMKWSEAD